MKRWRQLGIVSVPAFAALTLVGLMGGCSDDVEPGTDTDGRDAAADRATPKPTDDSGPKADSGEKPDAVTPVVDSGTKDTGTTPDTGTMPDTGTTPDTGTKPDSGGPDAGDSGTSDASLDGSMDASADGAMSDAGDAAARDGFFFDTDLDGFIDDYHTPAELVTALSHDPAVGYLGNGSAKLAIPFTGGGQKVAIAKYLSAFRDLRGKTLHVRIQLTSGLKQVAPFGGAKLYVKSATASNNNAYIYAANDWVNLDPSTAVGGWIDVSMPVSTPSSPGAGYDAQYVRTIGVEINTPGDGTGVTSAVVHVDAFSIE